MNADGHIQEVKSATLRRFNDLWKQNWQINRAAVMKNPGVVALRRRFKGAPAIVVGAGPSLDKNIQLLRRAQDKAVLIASDAALKPLLHHDIRPTFAVCLDPQEDIARFLKGVPHRGITLLAPSIAHPRVLALWQGDVVFFHKHAPDIPILTEIYNQHPGIGCLTPGGSVLTVAYDLAFQSGANPIIFMGQDLSYPRGNAYGRATDNADQGLKTTLEKQAENIVYAADMDGRVLPTLKWMVVSREWFKWAFTTWRRDEPLEIINASEAGILTDHCTLMPLAEAIHRHCTRRLNPAWTLKKALKKK